MGLVTRRDLLEWLGKGAVLALGADVLAACSRGGADGGIDAGGGLDSGAPDAGGGPDSGAADAGGGCGDAATSDFPFEPGSNGPAIFHDWPQRTVDPPDLAAILASYSLRVDGLVEEPREFSFADLLQLPRRDQVSDFMCVEGWTVPDVPWNGVRLAHVLHLARPIPGATHVTFHTLGDLYNESLPIEVALEHPTLLAYGVACATIPLAHGFPVRLVVPRLFGYKSAKHVYRIELADAPVDGYWEKRGYPYDGEPS
jgi:DMSO/TMAO reductase YedYZ molybdopterin-dependent catalytic subunit